MAVTLMCPNLRCKKILMVPNDARGTRVRCAYCGTQLMVPQVKGFNGKPFEPNQAADKGKFKKWNRNNSS